MKVWSLEASSEIGQEHVLSLHMTRGLAIVAAEFYMLEEVMYDYENPNVQVEFKRIDSSDCWDHSVRFRDKNGVWGEWFQEQWLKVEEWQVQEN
jgi:hypothetical protein